MDKNKKTKTALIVIDFQNEFIDGKLKLPYSENLINKVNNINTKFDLVCFTKNVTVNKSSEMKDVYISDVDHYCLKDTKGSDFPNNLEYNNNIFIRSYNESFSVYNSKNKDNTTLSNFLKQNDITHVFVCGLLADYPLKYSVLDFNNDFKTYVIIDVVKTKTSLMDLVKKLIEKNIPLVSTPDIKEVINGLKTNIEEIKRKKQPIKKIRKPKTTSWYNSVWVK